MTAHKLYAEEIHSCVAAILCVWLSFQSACPLQHYTWVREDWL